jgi:hypothetical protein
VVCPFSFLECISPCSRVNIFTRGPNGTLQSKARGLGLSSAMEEEGVSSLTPVGDHCVLPSMPLLTWCCY